MLFVINVNNVLHSKIHSIGVISTKHNYYVLDTDDLVVESVTGKQIMDYLQAGVQILNATTSGLYCQVTARHPFVWYLKAVSKPLVIENGQIVLPDTHTVVLNGKTNKFEVKGVAVFYNGVQLCKYRNCEFRFLEGISYLYRLGSYLVIRYIFSIAVELGTQSLVLTTLVIDNSGAIIFVLPSSQHEVAECYENENIAFKSKFITLCEGKY